MDTLDLTLIGEDAEGAGANWADAEAATVITIEQETWYEQGAPWERGERSGGMHGTAVLTPSGRLVCQFTFTLAGDSEDSVVASGVLPREGDDFGAGVLAVTGGTGRYSQASGTLHVETRNPKRYAFR